MQSHLIDVIVPAGGVGRRMKLNIPKQYALIHSKTVLEHTVDALLNCKRVGSVIVGVADNDEYFDSLEISKNKRVVKGRAGAERCDTVRLCLDYASTEYVMVHDAARPLVSLLDLENLCALADSGCPGGILACRVADTLKQVSNGKIIRTVPREDMYRAYTPQLFKLELLKKALDEAKKRNLNVTDDASAMELCGYDVRIVEGSADNFKLTTPEDLIIAKLLLEKNKE